jgi:hypothetical protein
MEVLPKVKDRLTGAVENTRGTIQKAGARIKSGSPSLIETAKGHVGKFTQMNRSLIGK